MRIKNGITKTWPLFTHGNGPSSESKLYKRIEKYANMKGEENQSVPNDLTVLTWSVPGENAILDNLMGKMNAELYIIPFSKPFEWTGKVTKTLKYLKYIETPYVMGLDALDVIPSTDEGNLWEETLEHFKSKNIDILYNAEKSSWPDVGFGTSLPEEHPLMFRLGKCKEIEDKVYSKLLGSEYQHLNTGCWIAKTEVMIKFYEDVSSLIEKYKHEIDGEDYFGGEQGFVRALAPEYYPKLLIDYDCTIFQTLVGVRDEPPNMSESGGKIVETEVIIEDVPTTMI